MAGIAKSHIPSHNTTFITHFLYMYLILKNYVTIPTISFYDMNAIRTS